MVANTPFQLLLPGERPQFALTMASSASVSRTEGRGVWAAVALGGRDAACRIAHFRRCPIDSVRGENETFSDGRNSDGCRMGRYKDYREPKRRGYDDD